MGVHRRSELTVKLPATVLLCALPGFGQANVGQLRLQVTDPAGLGVESTVELISEVNQFSDSYATDGKGRLQVDRLPFGVYQVRVHRQGFATFSGSLEIRSVIPVSYHVGLSVAVADHVGGRQRPADTDRSLPSRRHLSNWLPGHRES